MIGPMLLLASKETKSHLKSTDELRPSDQCLTYLTCQGLGPLQRFAIDTCAFFREDFFES